MAPVTDPDDDARRRLVREVVAGSPTEPFGVYLFCPGEPGAELARSVEQEVVLETFGNSPELLDKEYSPYAESSVFVCVIDHRRELPVGALRIVVPSPAGFKSFEDIAPVWGEDVEEMFERTGIPLEHHRIWDIATMAVDGEYRGKATIGLATLGLYQAMTTTARRCGIDYFVAILDIPVFRMMQSKLHLTFAGFTGVPPLPYLGSLASLPVWCFLPDVKKRFASADMGLHDIIFEGVGFEPVMRPLDLEDATARVTALCGTGTGSGWRVDQR
jgi:hypothetical protein